MVIEQRRHARAPIDTPVQFVPKGEREPRTGVGKDISVGGMFVETDRPAAFGAELVVHVRLPGGADVSALPAVVRWVRAGGMGVQFRQLGAVETHLITEVARKHGERA